MALGALAVNIEFNFTRCEGRIIAAAASNEDTTVDGVPHVRLDDQIGSERVAVVKADIEGGETKALLGMRRIIERDRPLLAVECWDADALASVESALPPGVYRRHEHVFCKTPTYVWEPI